MEPIDASDNRGAADGFGRETTAPNDIAKLLDVSAMRRLARTKIVPSGCPRSLLPAEAAQRGINVVFQRYVL
jgi:hypothetical protein